MLSHLALAHEAEALTLFIKQVSQKKEGKINKLIK